MNNKYIARLEILKATELSEKQIDSLCQWIRNQAKYVKKTRKLFANKFTASTNLRMK